MFFFFSSRRRHTRWTGDWSSDVCSSDLVQDERGLGRPPLVEGGLADAGPSGDLLDGQVADRLLVQKGVDGVQDRLVRRRRLSRWPAPPPRPGFLIHKAPQIFWQIIYCTSRNLN